MTAACIHEMPCDADRPQFGARASWLALCATLLLGACASAPERPIERVEAGAALSSRAADYALMMIGKPYRFGGSSPATGFDCSGLVQYSYRQVGVMLPRTTDDQMRAAEPIRVSSLRRGDLVFFDEEGKKNSHVGIYIGHGEFVHAPSTGKLVRTDHLDSVYWRKHISQARRY